MPTSPSFSPLRLLPLLAVGAFASQASIRLADPMLPQLAAEFGTGVATLSGVITAFAVAYGLMQLFFGPMADRFGQLRVIGAAAWAAAAGSAACALAGGPASLTALRLLTGTENLEERIDLPRATIDPPALSFLRERFALGDDPL